MDCRLSCVCVRPSWFLSLSVSAAVPRLLHHCRIINDRKVNAVTGDRPEEERLDKLLTEEELRGNGAKQVQHCPTLPRDSL